MKKRFAWILIFVVLIAAGVGIYSALRATTAPGITTPQKTYVALGDSVAAGVGLQGPSDSSACDRTNQSYPKLLAKKLNYNLLSLACSGATIQSGILGKQVVNDLAVQPQLQLLFAQPRPDVITATIGANDAGWGDVIRSCYVGQCGSTSQTADVDASINSLKTNFAAMLQQLQDHYKLGQPKFVVTDYYQVYPVAKPADCSSLIGISDSELTWLRDQRTKINAAIKDSVAGSSFAVLADADFSGHELCTNDTWVQGLTASNPYHPTAAGQTAIANRVIKALNQNK